jgi:membrane-bound metal-dependent hydrolase YbcI (DUF457 family)
MPSSLGHYAVAYIIHKLKKTLRLPALIVGSIIPDIESFVYFLTNGSFAIGREWLRSLIGIGTFGALSSVLLTVLVYPKLVSAFFGIYNEEAEQECRFSKTIVVSCLLGGLSHVLIDSSCHDYNPLFYPFTRQSFDFLVFTDDWRLSFAIVEIFLLVMLFVTMIVEIRKETKGFWSRILVGGC